MSRKNFIAFTVLMIFAVSTLVSAETAPLPSAKDYLTSEMVSPVILNAGTVPDTYLFPNDWVKQQDWDAIRKKYGGTTLNIVFEGTDIGAPMMTKAHFEKLSGIKLNFQGMTIQEQFQKMLVSFSTGKASFDIITVLTPNLPVFQNFLYPLDDLIRKWKYDIDDFFPHFKSLMTDTPLVPGGKIYGLPNDYDQHFLHCRKNMLDKIGADGPPKTYDELTDYCKRLKGVLPANVYPIGFMADRSFFIWETFWNVAASFGADYFKPGTWEPVFDGPEAINAANFIAELFEKGYAAPGSLSWDYVRQLEAWNNGRLAMCFQYPIQESYNSKNSKIAGEPRYHSILPKGPGPKGRTAVHGTTTNVLLAMNKMSNKKDAAFIWMAFNCSAEVQYIYTVTGTGIDYGRKRIFANDTANVFYPNAQASYESVPYIYNDLQIAPREEIVQMAIPVFQSIFARQAKAEQALPELNKRVRKVMERYGYLTDNPPAPAPKSFWNWDLYPAYHNMKWEDGVGK